MIRVPRAAFTWSRHSNIVALVDRFSARLPTRSVTNDAEGVIEVLRRGREALRPGRRGVYCAPGGAWGEVGLEAGGRFAGFRLLEPHDRTEAAEAGGDPLPLAAQPS